MLLICGWRGREGPGLRLATPSPVSPQSARDTADATRAPTGRNGAADGQDGTPDTNELTPPTKAARRRRRWLDVLAVVALLTVILYFHLRVVRVAFITSGSMMPTINPGDRIVVHLSAYNNGPPQRGDVVALAGGEEGGFEIKRVVGVPADELVVAWGVVFRNGKPINESYVRQAMFLEEPTRAKLGDGELFVMGDNRNASEDSRDYGPVPESEVVGRVCCRILPLSRASVIH